MKLLDLFCGAGGAAMGYHLAGFEIIGVDNKKQPNYPFEFHQMDWKEGLEKFGNSVDIIHASPPCQGYSKYVRSHSSKWVPTKGKDEPRLINDVRKELTKPYIIENVVGADDLQSPILLCGSMFNLPIARHRLFEISPSIAQPLHPKCRGMAKRYSEENNIEYRDMRVSGKGRHAGTSERWKSFLGVTWNASQSELPQMVPPAYTQFIGQQLFEKISPQFLENSSV